jgi:hypothetical protein
VAVAEEVAEVAASQPADFAAVNAELDERTGFLLGLRDTTFFDPEPESTLDRDDAALAPLSASATARSTFLAAAECLAPDAALAASFALLRGALESAAVAIWLLESDDPAVRATRLLSEAWGDIRDSDRLAIALNSAPDARGEHERDWKAAHAAAFGDTDPSARQLPTSMAAKIDAAATVVADFTQVPGAAAVVRGSWQAFGALARGRTDVFDLADGTAAMTAGSRSLVLDVLETAASLYRVRAVGPAAPETAG